MQTSSRPALRAACVPLFFLAAGCVGTSHAPEESAAPRFAVTSSEAPAVEAAELAEPPAPTEAAAFLQPEAEPWPFTPEFADPESRATRTSSQSTRSQSWRVNRPPDNNFTFMIGARDFNNTDWSGIDSNPDIAFTEDSKVYGGNFSVDFGVHYSASGTKAVPETGTNASSEIWEFDLGLLKRFAPGKGIWQPYIGAGVALVRAAGTLPTAPEPPRDHDWSFGLYARAGLAIAVSEGGNVGLDFRYLGATDVTLSGISTDVNGPTASLFFGVGF